MIGLNVGSGQRKFGEGWINIDIVSRPGQVPDMLVKPGEPLPIEDETADYVVLHHVIEHFGCNEANGLILDCWRCLKPEGSLLIFVPNLRALAQAWLTYQIDDYTYMVNSYGAYQGEEGDRHKWGYSQSSLMHYLSDLLKAKVKLFNNRTIPGADIAQDWWIASAEVIKPKEIKDDGTKP